MACRAVASHNDDKSSSEGIRCFYLMYDVYSKDQRSFKCIVMDKLTGETNDLTISPAPNTREPQFFLKLYTAVSIGSTIYMIGGACRCHFCPDDVIHLLHAHAEVRVFNPLRPEDGWRDVARMHIPRLRPAAVVVDGMIYVFGGTKLEDPEDGEWYDPNTDTWHLFSAEGYQPSLACVEAFYVDPTSGAKKVVVKSRWHDDPSLYTFLLDEQIWETGTSVRFKNCASSCVLGNIIYALVVNDDPDESSDEEYDKKYDEKQVLQAYHLIRKQWFPVELPPGILIIAKATHIIASGSDRLCLMFHKFVKGEGVECDRMTCLELRLDEEYTTGSDGMTINATKVSSTYFAVKFDEFRQVVITL
ncbi:hypothetical protein CASFOL_038588 [Castilleja foliolosa]|uniref:Uncharacterized protein n=1 Tax=Castilleja foliolosa TaxID=1961234 RepID=A0ABD3BLW2_9LAMI